MDEGSLQSKESGLLESPLFRQIPKDKLDEIARAVGNRVVPPRTVIFRQGDPGDSFYIIASGRVRVFRQDTEGLEMDLSELRAGESFGEMALITGEPRSANVETVEETRLIVLSKDQFDPILKDFPTISLAFVKQISTWLLRDEKIIEMEVRRQYEAPRLAWSDFLLIVGVSVLFALIFNQSNPNGVSLFPHIPPRDSIGQIAPSAAMDQLTKGEALVVDAMPSNFYDKRHIKGAVNMPLALFDIVYMMAFGEEGKEKKIIVYGGTISRPYDLEVANKLLLRGHRNVKILEGNISAWEKNGYPVEP